MEVGSANYFDRDLILGISGYIATSFLLGIIYCLYSISIFHLRSVGKRLGEEAVELEGSLYGRSSLDAFDHSNQLFTSSTLPQPSSTRSFFKTSKDKMDYENDSAAF